MSHKFLKIAKNILAKSLCDIYVFNASFESKIFLQDFKIAKVTHIFNPILPGLLNTLQTQGAYFTPP